MFPKESSNRQITLFSTCHCFIYSFLQWCSLFWNNKENLFGSLSIWESTLAKHYDTMTKNDSLSNWSWQLIFYVRMHSYGELFLFNLVWKQDRNILKFISTSDFVVVQYSISGYISIYHITFFWRTFLYVLSLLVHLKIAFENRQTATIVQTDTNIPFISYYEYLLLTLNNAVVGFFAKSFYFR